MPLTFHTPKANATSCIATYAALTCKSWVLVPSDSNLVNAEFVAINPIIGFLNAIITIMMLNICSPLPDMYIMMAVIGSCLMGARATSQAFLSLRVSVSAVVGCFRAPCLAAAICFLFPLAAAVNPGGSGMTAAFGFVTGGPFKSMIHCGGGGGNAIVSDMLYDLLVYSVDWSEVGFVTA